MSVQVLKVAVIGAGGIARNVHLPSLSEISSCRVVAVCDLVADRARAMQDAYAIEECYVSYTELLECVKPDAVFILVRPDELYRIALDCLNAGCHVFMEKPAGITLFQAQSLARAAQKAGKQLQVGLNRRFIPLLNQVIDTLKGLGSLHQIDGWFYKNGDAAFYQGCSSAFTCDAIHTIDLIRYAAQSEVQDVSMVAGRYDSPVDNAWNGWIRFENGITGTFHSNYATGGRVHGIALHGAKASAYVNLGFGGEACEATLLYSVKGTHSLAAGGKGNQRIEIIDGLKVAGSDRYHRFYGYYAQNEAFVQAVLQGRPVPCNIEDAVHTMELLDRLERAAV